MPQTSSARKKLRGDARKTVINVRRRRSLKTLLKQARETKTVETIRQAIAQIDKSVKNHLMHKNKGARLKSQLMKNTAAPAAKTVPKKAKKAGVKKATAKKSTAKAKK